MSKVDLVALLRKFMSEPGRMTVEQHEKVQVFFMDFKKLQNIYKTAFISEPIGDTIDSHIKKSEWYIDFLKNK